MEVNGQLVAPAALLQCNNPRYLLDRKEAGWLPQPVWVLQGYQTPLSQALSHCVD